MKVLYVEDDAEDFYAVETLTRALPSITLLRATSLRRAIERLDASIDLVLLDLTLPDSNGPHSITQILDIGLVPVVVLTGRDNDKTALLALKLGAQDYLVKGKFEKELLSRTCLYAVERHRLLTELDETKALVARDREVQALAENTSVPTQNQLSYKESHPERFRLLVQEYATLLEQALKVRAFKVSNTTSASLRQLANELGSLQLTPRDLTEIHSEALRQTASQSPATKAAVYREEGLYLLIGLMGHLTSYYRDQLTLQSQSTSV